MEKSRIIGFDLARAYAIFGMYIVNFNFCFGFTWLPLDPEPMNWFLSLFTGNSTSIFIFCTGMGLVLMSKNAGSSKEQRAKMKSIVLKRSWFLLALGLLLFSWWPGDILHFYGGYMHIAAFLLFIPKKYYLWIATFVVISYHILIYFFNVETGWDLSNFSYLDFWTIKGFLRNTLFNGWNSMFPWLAYFLVGMWLGYLNWQDNTIKKRVFSFGFIVFIIFEALRYYAKHADMVEFWKKFILFEYFPPYFPFMALTMSFALMVIPICMFLGERFGHLTITKWIAATGRMTLTHYVLHITLGILVLGLISGIKYTGFAQPMTFLKPTQVLLYSIGWYILSIIFTIIWSKYFKNGPLEMLMRKLSNG
jgi:uncharacterized protein